MKLMPVVTFLDMGGGWPDGWCQHGFWRYFALYDPRTGMTTLYREPTRLEAIFSAHQIRDVDTDARHDPYYNFDLFNRTILPDEYDAIIDFCVWKYGNTRSTDRLRSDLGHERKTGLLTWGDFAVVLTDLIPEEAA